MASLYLACRYNEIAEVRAFLNANPPINPNLPDFILDSDGSTPLLVACLHGHLEVVKLLLSHPAIDVNCGNLDGVLPVHLAAGNGFSEILDLLLRHPTVDINKPDVDGATAFWKTAQEGKFNTLEMLLANQQVNVNQAWKGATFTTPIQQAARCGKGVVVQMLWDCPRLNRKCMNWNVLHRACAAQDVALFYQGLALIDRQPEVLNQQDTCGFTPLHFLAVNRCYEMLQALLQFPHLDSHLTDVCGRIPLWLATSERNLTAVKIMMVYGKPIRTDVKSFNGSEHWCNKAASDVAKDIGATSIINLIGSYANAQQQTVAELRKELEHGKHLASELLALLLLYFDEFLVINPSDRATYHQNKSIQPNSTSKNQNVSIVRFLMLIRQLPLELQMLICNFTYEINRKFVSDSMLTNALHKQVARLKYFDAYSFELL